MKRRAEDDDEVEEVTSPAAKISKIAKMVKVDVVIEDASQEDDLIEDAVQEDDLIEDASQEDDLEVDSACPVLPPAMFLSIPNMLNKPSTYNIGSFNVNKVNDILEVMVDLQNEPGSIPLLWMNLGLLAKFLGWDISSEPLRKRRYAFKPWWHEFLAVGFNSEDKPNCDLTNIVLKLRERIRAMYNLNSGSAGYIKQDIPEHVLEQMCSVYYRFPQILEIGGQVKAHYVKIVLEEMGMARLRRDTESFKKGLLFLTSCVSPGCLSIRPIYDLFLDDEDEVLWKTAKGRLEYLMRCIGFTTLTSYGFSR